MKLIQGHTIWDASRITDREKTRIENPSLVRFKDHWYCTAQESPSHNPHPLGRTRILRSGDGAHWESVHVLEWDGGSVGAFLSVTAEGLLMASGQIYFVSREPRADLSRWVAGTPLPPPPDVNDPNPMVGTPFCHYQLDPLGTVLNLPNNDAEPGVTMQFTTWLSADGLRWSSAHCCANMINTEPFHVTWHNGMGYVIGQWGKDAAGTLYRTRDGKDWRVLKANFAPEGHCNEGTLAFGVDNTAYCLFRDGDHQVMLGIGTAPYYQEWNWRPARVDYGPEAGGPRPASEVLGTSLGGTQLLRLSDGRLLGAGRALGPGRDDGRATLFLVDPNEALLTLAAEFDGTSYPWVVEHAGELWVTYIGSACHAGQWEVHLARVPVPE